MARIRTIKPEFWKHEDLSALPESTHMLAAALLNYADDEGYFNANPALVKAECFPLRESSVSAHDSLKMLSEVGYIELGEGHDGKRYGRIVKFDEHQRVNRPTPSKIKALTISWENSLNPHGAINDDSPPEGKGKERKGKEEAFCTAPSATAPAEPDEPPLLTIQLNDGSEHPITKAQADEFAGLYPAVDVPQALRSIKAWVMANPTRRKTKGGVMRFVNGWLAREQNSGGGRGRVAPLYQSDQAPPRPMREVSL